MAGFTLVNTCESSLLHCFYRLDVSDDNWYLQIEILARNVAAPGNLVHSDVWVSSGFFWVKRLLCL